MAAAAAAAIGGVLGGPCVGLAAAAAGRAPAVRPAPIYGLAAAQADHPDPVSHLHAAAPAAPAAVPGGTWQPLGPAPIGPSKLAGGLNVGATAAGRITSFAVIPSGTHAGRLVAGTAGGGVWTSDDSGATWTARTDFAADLSIGSVAVDPGNPDHLIAGTGEGNQCGDCFPGDGILTSTDGGDTWTLQNPGSVFNGLTVADVAVDPSNSNHEFAATSHGLYVTTDGGSTWAQPSDASYGSVVGTDHVDSVVIDPSTPSTVYIAGGIKSASGSFLVAKSTDGGTTWAAAATGIAAPGGYPTVKLAIAKSAPSTLYVSVGSENAVALYKSTDGAGSWTHLTATPDYTGSGYGYNGSSGGSEQGWYDNTVAVDPTDPNHVLAGGIAVVESTDGGTSWTNVNGQGFFGFGTNKLHPDQHALAFTADGSSVWIGDDGGVFHYTPATASSSATVTAANGNLNNIQFYFGFNEVGGTVLAGTQDNASAQTTSSTMSAWTGIYTGDGGPSAITAGDPSLRFIEADGNLYCTTNAFASQAADITPPTNVGAGPFTPPMTVIPNAATPSSPTLLYGGVDLWRSTNPGSCSPSWSQVTSVGSGVSAIAVSPGNPQVVYVGFTNGTIQVSTNGGQTFTTVASETDSGSEQFVTGMSVDPTNPYALTASFSYSDTRYRSPSFPHVEQYSWSGAAGAQASGTWTSITGNLPSAAVSRVIYQTGPEGGALLAATDTGVYATSSANGASTSWSPVGTGLPNVQVQDLYIDSADPGKLYIVTHGRGAWLLQTPAPSNTAPPTVSGTAVQGQTLTESHGTWTNSPTSYAYQWEDCDSSGANCTAIAGATAQTYTLTAADVGSTIRVQETAMNLATSSPASSDPTGVVIPNAPPGNTGLPTISGVTQSGQTLSESHGTWTNSPTGYTYQWEDCDSSGGSCAAITGATAQTYTLTDSDVGHTIRVLETASNLAGAGTPASSDATAVVTALPAPPSNTSPPMITGTAQLGTPLTESHGAWTNSPTGYTYQWMQCDSSGNMCQDIAGATSQTYTPAAADVGHTIEVRETASNAGGSGSPATSAPTAAVLPLPPSNQTAPTISGVTTAGNTLTVTQGTWANDPTTIADQWEQCDSSGGGCSAIAGATGPTYTLTAADVGHTIRVSETAQNAAAPTTVVSAATAVIAAAPVQPVPPSNTAAPSVTGTARVGQTLTAAVGQWSGAAPISFTEQWQRCTPACADIAGATGAAYTLVAADAGAFVRVVVTATNSAGSAQANSAQVGPVVSAAPSVTAIRSALSQALKAAASAKLTAIVRHHRYTFTFVAPGAGTLVMNWYYLPPGARLARAKPVLIARARAVATKPGRLRVTLSLTAAGRRRLGHTKRLNLTGEGVFKPAGGAAVTVARRFTLRR